MPITIYENLQDEKGTKSVAFLCEDTWELPGQVFALEAWLNKKGHELPTSNYIADIGFSDRPDASGGGGVLSPDALGIMAKVGMWLYLSEYNK